MIKKVLLVFPFLLALAFVGVQYRFTAHIPAQASSFTTDNFNNIYIVKNDLLEKFNVKGELLKTYSNKNLGPISYVDATNPLRLIVFYKAFNQVVFLDNMLAQNSNILNLFELDLGQPSLVGSSFNNGLWLYNPSNSELIRLDNNFRIVNRSGNLSQVLNRKLNPDFLVEYNNRLYLKDPTEGILVFDIFATYSKIISIKELEKFQVKEDQILYLKNDTIHSFNLKTFSEALAPSPVKDAVQARTEGDNLFILGSSGISVFKPSKE